MATFGLCLILINSNLGSLQLAASDEQQSLLRLYAHLPLQVPQDVLIKLERLTMLNSNPIGGGNFGNVFLYHYDRGGSAPDTVAVKKLRPGILTGLTNFLNEGSRMREFKHTNIQPLIGISFENYSPLLVTPYLQNGDVRRYVLDRRNVSNSKNYNFKPSALFQSPPVRLMIQWTIQITSAMSYLHSRAFIHRDLAARNYL